MNAVVKKALTNIPVKDIASRVNALDWERVSKGLDDRGCAMIESLLTAEECDALVRLYPVEGVFRSRVVMARHGFGSGEYKYFSYPLPNIVSGLRTAIYPHLAPIANQWNEAMDIDAYYPAKLSDFIARCHAAGQLRPTPLMLYVVFLFFHGGHYPPWRNRFHCLNFGVHHTQAVK